MQAEDNRLHASAPHHLEEEEQGSLDLMVLLVDLFKGFKRFWWLLLLLVLAGGAYNLLGSQASYTPMYRAEATFTIATRSTTNIGSGDYSFNYSSGIVTQMARTFPYILSSDILQTIIKEDLGVSSLNGSISATGVEATNLFILRVTSTSQDDAYRILLSAIKNYPRVAEFIIGDTKLNMLSDPEVTQSPYNAVPRRRIMLRGMVMGGLAGGALLLLYAMLRRTIRKEDDIRTQLNQKSLAVLPHVAFKRRKNKGAGKLIILSRQVTPAYKEAIRSLRTRVSKEMAGLDARVLLVTSTLPGEGKSTLALNLALSLAQKGARVALLDADLRHQRLQHLLSLDGVEPTLAEVLSGQARLQDAMHERYLPGFYFVPYGQHRGDTMEALRAPALAGLVDDLARMMDYVIIDTPPAGILSDAAALAALGDCLLYLIRQDTAKVSQVLDGLQNIAYSGIPIIGCVLNDASAGFTGYGYGYGYGYGSRYAYGYGRTGSYGQRGSYGADQRDSQTDSDGSGI